MQYPIGFPIQFQASLNLAFAGARKRFFDTSAELPMPYNFRPSCETLEELPKERAKTSTADFGKLAWKALKEGLWRPELAEPGMKEFLQTISREVYRVYRSEINEQAKTLKLWVRRKSGKLVCSNCSAEGERDRRGLRAGSP